jgi:hypothetical protein
MNLWGRDDAKQEKGAGGMLYKLSEQIEECHRYAAECREKAARASSDALRNDYIFLEQRWLSLAASYEFTERLEDFQPQKRG